MSDDSGDASSAWGKLRRRKLVQWALAYAAGAWVLLQVLGFLASTYAWPIAALRISTGVVLVGFPMALVLAWYHGERGEQKVNGVELLILAALFTVGGGLVWRVEHEHASEAGQASNAASSAQSARPAPSAKSIAVLPFVNMSGEAENEFFSDGLSEEILNSLARIDTMRVVGRTSSFHFKSANEDLRTIGEKLGVANVLEGSVRRSGNRARITAQLVRALDGIHLWSQTYDRTLSDTLAVQLDIAEHVAGALDVVMDDQQRERMRSAGVKNVDAFIAYQKGVRLYSDAHDPTKSDDLIAALRRANAEFARAIELEPDLSLAHFLSTDLYEHLILSDATAPAERAPAWKAALAGLDQALRTSHDPQQRLFIEADRQLLSDDWRGLVPRIEAALAGDGCGEVVWVQQLSYVFGFAARFEALSQRLLTCDPLDYNNHLRRAEAANWAGHPEHVLEFAAATERVLGEAPSTLTAQRVRALLALGRFDEARAVLASLSGGSEVIGQVRLIAAAAMGADGTALHKLWQETDRSHSRLGVWSLVEISVAALSGDRAEANRLAAVMDARPAGPLLLAIVAEYCQCSAPFDLDATPNFKARITEAGLPWPPPETIKFPKQPNAAAR